MANVWDSVLTGNKPSAIPANSQGSNVWGKLLGNAPTADTSVPHPQPTKPSDQPVIAGFEGIDFSKVSDKDLRSVQRDFIHPSDLDFSTKEVQERISKGTREGDFIKLPETNIFDKYSGQLVYLPQDQGRLANAMSKYPDTEIKQKKEGETVPKDVMANSRFITVTDANGKEQKQLISNKDYYLKRLKEGGTNPLSAVFTAASVGMEMLDDYKKKDFEDMTVQEKMAQNQRTIESWDREKKQKANLAAQGVTGREKPANDYVEPSGFFGQAWEQLVSGFGYQMPRSLGGLAEMLGEKAGNQDLAKWGRDFGDEQLARFLKKPELLPPTDLAEFSKGGYKDPRWYGQAVGSLIPTIATTFGTMTLAGLASGGNPAVIGAAGSSVVFAQESSFAYNNMIDRGINPQDAAHGAMIYGTVATALEGLSEIRIGKKILSSAAKDALSNSFKHKLLSELPKTILLESGTEGMQQFTQNVVTKWMDDNQKLMEGVIDSMAAGALGGIAFGAGELAFDNNVYANKADAPVTLETLSSGAGEGGEQKTSADLRDKYREQSESIQPSPEVIDENKKLLDYEDAQSTTAVETPNAKIDVVQYSDNLWSSRITIKEDQQSKTIPFEGKFNSANEAVVGAVEAAKGFNLSPAIEKQLQPYATVAQVEQAKTEIIDKIKQSQNLIAQQNEKITKLNNEKITGADVATKAIPEDKRLADVSSADALDHLNEKQFERWVALRSKEKYENDNQLVNEAAPVFTALMARGRYEEAAQIRAALPDRFDKGVTDSVLADVKNFMDQSLSANRPVAPSEPTTPESTAANPEDKGQTIFAEGAMPPMTKKELDEKPQTVGIEDAISWQEKNVPVGERLQTMMQKAYVHMKDEMYPLAKVFGEDSAVMDKVRNFAGAAARAEQMLLGEGTFDYKTYKKNGESLRDILKGLSDEQEKDLKIYLVARREKSLQETHPEYKTNIALPEVKAKIKEIETKYPNMKEIGDRVRDFNDRVLQYAIDSGFISEEQGQVIRDQNPDYTAPMFREVENQSGGFLSGAIGKVGNPIKRIKGTLDVDLKIMDPLQNIVKNTYHILDAINKNEIKQGIVEAAEKNPDLAEYVKKTKPKMVPVGTVEHRAVFDKQFEDQLVGLANKLGLQEFEKTGKAGRNLGHYDNAGKTINKKIGTGRETLAHEVGHFFDMTYGLRQRFEKLSEQSTGKDKYKELDEMLAHSENKGETKKRLGSSAEKFANAFSWWMSQRALAERDMPVFSMRMREIIKQIPALEPLLTIEPSPRPEIESDVENIFGISFKQPDGIIDVKINGDRQYYEVDMDVYRSLMGLDKQQSNILVELLAAPARMLRAGATLIPEFSLRNPLRDQLTAAINSKNQYVPFVDLAKSLYKMLKQSPEQKELERLYKISGADYASIVSPDRASMELAVRDIVKGRDATYYVKHPIDLLRMISEYGETATRISDFSKSLEKFGRSKEGIMKAGKEARDLTLNFGKQGATGKVINRIVAFFNAQLEDMDKMVRMHKNAPKKTIFRALSYVTLPSVLLWFINRDNPDYEELPQWRKDLFWNIPVGGGKVKFIAVPKPFGYGILYGSTVERMLTSMDKGSAKKGFDGYSDTLFRGFLPSIAPTAVVPVVENWANKSSFLDRPIVPDYKKDLEPELQYDRYTSDSAKFLGQTFGYSPAKIENLIRGYGAGLGKYGLETLDWASGLFADRPAKPDKGVADAPILRAFLTDKPTGYGSESVAKFYELSDEADKSLKSYNALAESNPDRAAEYLNDHATEIALAKRMDGMRKEISSISKERDTILEDKKMTGKEKADQLDVLDDQILEKAQGFLKELEGQTFTPEEAKTNAVTQTDEKAFAEAYNAMNDEQKAKALDGMTDSRKAALRRGQEDILLDQHLEDVKSGDMSAMKARSEIKKQAAKLYDTKRMTSAQKAHVTKLVNEFNIRNTFGGDNETVKNLLKATSNEDKVQILIDAKASLKAEELAYLIRKGRTTKLISDNVFKAYMKASRQNNTTTP